MISENELKSLYYNNMLSTAKIARKLNCSQGWIVKLMQRFGLKARTNSEANRGKLNHRWMGGIIKHHHGYIYIYNPSHPFCNKHGQVLKHRLVMERKLGRYLKPEEVVHHKNEDTSDNRISNLKLFKNQSEHLKYHRRNK